MNIEYSIAQKTGADGSVKTDHLSILLGGDQLDVGSEVVSSGKCAKSGLLLTLCDGGKEHEKALECAEACNSEFSVLLSDIPNVSQYDEVDAKRKLGEGIKRANELMLQLSETEESIEMVSSIASLWMCQNFAVFSNVGNVRIYRFSDGVLQQLTDDHTEAWELVKEGKITPEKAMTYPGDRVMTQLLGGKGKTAPSPEIEVLKVEAGDCFVLCTDGVSHHLQQSSFETLLEGQLDEAGRLSADAANQVLEAVKKTSEVDDHASVIVLQAFPRISRWKEMIQELEAESA